LTQLSQVANFAPKREGFMTVTRAQLSEEVYRRVGLSRIESAELVESVIAEISGALERGEMVKISSFGSFAVRQKGRRIGRNPKTGQEVPISPRRVLVFRASHALKDQIKQGLAEGGNGTGAERMEAKGRSA
jgi:integration host factor subunit alpha